MTLFTAQWSQMLSWMLQWYICHKYEVTCFECHTLLTSDVPALFSPTDPQRSHTPSCCSWWRNLKRKIKKFDFADQWEQNCFIFFWRCCKSWLHIFLHELNLNNLCNFSCLQLNLYIVHYFSKVWDSIYFFIFLLIIFSKNSLNWFKLDRKDILQCYKIFLIQIICNFIKIYWMYHDFHKNVYTAQLFSTFLIIRKILEHQICIL